MSQTTSATNASIALDLLLTATAFVGFFFWVKSHVASEDIAFINFWGAYTAASLSGAFWLALQMFKVVYRHQKAAKSQS